MEVVLLIGGGDWASALWRRLGNVANAATAVIEISRSDFMTFVTQD
jgi:hypothetical protein